ncbi:MAG TPA: 50S ribosomal protein L11 methyltransferase [Oceanicaulis sp.]|uniref:Ribosomal protein L11 methyltransferase n=1 Tax=Glycocaulis albus TaxID=1382801 RepID=A0ABQ1XEA3_9PROT|nr:50S ribosomal protein L11 methyltransferase [Glycocaulis albus]MBV5257201.1 methyltransferase domain-containing protein [Synechococcus moorigangaii CMS01]GGG92036.1 ribosomal protein L11 methyltransferase [Glycocaulis albus]HCY56726.1 50S ribosomal protein L11 methyltransferase [Oceanicaulis sp.]
MSTLWRLLAIGPAAPMKAADAALNAWEDGPMLSWSFFEDGSEEVWRLDVLFNQQIDVDRFLAGIGLTGADIDVQFAPLPEEDWVRLSLAGLPAVKAGRFVIYGEHAKAELAPGEIGIEIEAGPAFGTGHHGTTKGCLIACDRLEREGLKAARVLDLGCGTGALAIAAALVWPDADILATDIDPEAVAETAINNAKNGVADRIEAITADGFDHPAFEGAVFDLIFANILAGPLQELARALAERLAPDGRAVLSGLLEEQITGVEAAYAGAGLVTEHTDIIEGWAILTLKAG